MKLGPYELGYNISPECGIYEGDARVLSEAIPDGSVDLVLIDPPYFLPAAHYQNRKNWPRTLSDLVMIESYFDWVALEARRILKDKGVFVTFCDGQSYPIFYVKLYRIYDRLIDIVWDKGRIGLGGGIRRQHEWLLMGAPGSAGWNGWSTSIIQCSPVPSKDRIHPAEKPTELLQKIIELAAPAGGIVCDFFSGSGSACVAAWLAYRRYLAFELDTNYAEAARQRVRQTQPPLFVPENEQLALPEVE
jgi:site-specific DNA-methyltransferase (adenine-specific)